MTYTLNFDSPKGTLVRYEMAWVWRPENMVGITFWRMSRDAWYNAAGIPLEVMATVELLGG